jgi:hypothetical protein
MGDMMDINRRGGGRSSPSGIWSWDDLLYGRCGGMYPLTGAGAGLPRRETYEEGATFEETYPQVPLLRAGPAFGRPRQCDRPPPGQATHPILEGVAKCKAPANGQDEGPAAVRGRRLSGRSAAYSRASGAESGAGAAPAAMRAA